jgi:alpha-tubulin suppressor-like RCC1 family protein
MDYSCRVMGVLVACCFGCPAVRSAAPGLGVLVESPVDVSLGDGSTHRCAIMVSRRVRCQGENWAGQIGRFGSSNPQEWSEVEGLEDVVQVVVSSSNASTCALTEGGHVYCWGSNEHGQLGVTDTGERCEAPDRTVACRRRPTRLTMLSEIVSISRAYSSTCALSRVGKVFCWGAAIPFPGVSSSRLPTEMPTLRDVTHLWGAGVNFYVRRASGQVIEYPREVRVMGVEREVIQQTSGSVICGVSQESRLRCFGRSSAGLLGSLDEALDDVGYSPEIGGVQSAAVGVNHACVVRDDGTVWCWGEDTDGVLGSSQAQPEVCERLGQRFGCLRYPVRVEGVTGARRVFVGIDSTCALDHHGSLWCWGRAPGGRSSRSPQRVLP